MKSIIQKNLFIGLFIVMSCNNSANNKKLPGNTISKTEYELTVDRGAFHYDKFVVTIDKIAFVPENGNNHEDVKYNQYSETLLDSSVALAFFREIEEKGVWNLENEYKTNTSCTSGLTLTLKANGKSKTIICDDFDRGSPELIKYIDKKVVELEGNDLKRIYLPG